MSAVVALKTIFSPNMFSHAVIKENGRVSSRARGLITTHFVSNNKKQALYFHISDSILWLWSIIDTTTTEQWVQTLLDLNSGYTQKLKLVTGYGFCPHWQCFHFQNLHIWDLQPTEHPNQRALQNSHVGFIKDLRLVLGPMGVSSCLPRAPY